jgi:hypothetical protein
MLNQPQVHTGHNSLFDKTGLARLEAGADLWLDQKNGREPQENEKTSAVGNGSDQHTGACCGVAAQFMKSERYQHPQ